MEDLAEQNQENFVGTWVLYLGHKGYICNGLFQAPGVRDWGGREGGGAASVCGEGRWVRMRPRSGLPLK